jgi:quercetin dioxygenase-like cupin family protein
MRNPVGGSLTFKTRSAETGGALTALESVAAPGEGPPLHAHAGNDETMYVVDGSFRFIVDGEFRDGPAGTCVFIPRRVPHTWQNVGDEPGRLFVAFTPGAPGMETFFERFAAHAAPGPEAFRELAGDAGMTVVGPPLSASH